MTQIQTKKMQTNHSKAMKSGTLGKLGHLEIIQVLANIDQIATAAHHPILEP